MKNKKYLIMVLVGFSFNLLETALFGWHSKAQSGAESFCDTISIVLIAWGIIGDITTNLTIVKRYFVTNRTTVNTQKVEIKGKPLRGTKVVKDGEVVEP